MKKLTFVFLFAFYAPFVWCQVLNGASGCDTPSGNFTYQIDNKTVIFSNTVVSATTWKWDFGDGDTSTSKEPTHNYRTYGSFNVCLTAFSDCSQALFCNTIALTQLITAVEEISESPVKVFPNPVSNQLLVSFNGLLPQRISIINPLGSTMLSYTQEEVRSSMCFDFSQYPAGVYILTWAITGGIQSCRIVKIN
jgi:PKD domain/Secretion system C-terminal sorting domain